MSNIKTAIVCMASNENIYIRDFVKWHTIIGFDKIFIIDNSPVNGEHPDFILSDYINSGKVQIIPMYKNSNKNPQFLQMIVYTVMYEIYHEQFDWMFFIDVDEFLMFTEKSGTHNVNEYLNNDYLNEAEQIRFNWQCYGDNGQLYYDNQPVWKRFPKPMSDIKKFDWCGPYPVNCTLKTAVRCTAKYANFVITKSPHWCLTDTKENAVVVSPSGIKRPYNKSVNFIDYRIAFLAHYRTLTISEYLHRRLDWTSLGNPTGTIHSKEIFLKQFCVENEMTPEKQKIWDEYIARVEREHPGIFEGDNLKTMSPSSDEDFQNIVKDVREAILETKVWEH